MRKKLLSMLLALTMVLSLVPTAAFAAEEQGLTFAQYTDELGDWAGTVKGSDLGTFTFKMPEEPQPAEVSVIAAPLEDHATTDPKTGDKLSKNYGLDGAPVVADGKVTVKIKGQIAKHMNAQPVEGIWAGIGIKASAEAKAAASWTEPDTAAATAAINTVADSTVVDGEDTYYTFYFGVDPEDTAKQTGYIKVTDGNPAVTTVYVIDFADVAELVETPQPTTVKVIAAPLDDQRTGEEELTGEALAKGYGLDGTVDANGVLTATVTEGKANVAVKGQVAKHLASDDAGMGVWAGIGILAGADDLAVVGWGAPADTDWSTVTSTVAGANKKSDSQVTVNGETYYTFYFNPLPDGAAKKTAAYISVKSGDDVVTYVIDFTGVTELTAVPPQGDEITATLATLVPTPNTVTATGMALSGSVDLKNVTVEATTEDIYGTFGSQVFEQVGDKYQVKTDLDYFFAQITFNGLTAGKTYKVVQTNPALKVYFDNHDENITQESGAYLKTKDYEVTTGTTLALDFLVSGKNSVTFAISEKNDDGSYGDATTFTVTSAVDVTKRVVAPAAPTLTFTQYTVTNEDLTQLGGKTTNLGTFTGFTADNTNKVTLGGTAKYVEWTGFNGVVTAENKGHYLPLTVTGTAGDKITVTNRSDGSKNGKEHTLDAEGKYETIVWLDGAQDGYAGTAAASLPAKTFTVKVEHDSKATTYSIDFSGVTLELAVTGVHYKEQITAGADLDNGLGTAGEDWVDQTMWVDFSRPLAEEEYALVKVDAPNATQDTDTDWLLCIGNGEHARFAWSFLNTNQMANLGNNTTGAKTEGEYTVTVYSLSKEKYEAKKEELATWIPNADTDQLIPIGEAHKITVTKTDNADLESLSLSDVHYAPAADTITVKVTGTAKYVELPGFNATVPEEQKGHYMPITITGGAANGELVVTNRSDGAQNGKTSHFDADGKYETVVWLDGKQEITGLDAKTFKIVTGGKTYIVDFYEVTMENAPAAKYTVTFNTAGGSAVEAQTVEKDQTASKPTDPTKTGYTFKGWFTTADGETAFDFNDGITADTTVYAQWTKKESTVETETEVKDGTASTTVKEEDVTAAIDKAVDEATGGKTPVVVIDTTAAEGAADAPKAETSIPASTAGALKDKADATIVTNVGEVTVSKDVMAAVDSTSDKPLVLTTEKAADGTVTVNLTQDNKPVEFTEGTVTASFPTDCEEETSEKIPAVYYVDENGETVEAKAEDCTVTVTGGKATVTFHNPKLMGKKISVQAKTKTPDPTPSNVTYTIAKAADGDLMSYTVTVEHLDANAVLTIQVRPDGCTSGPVFYATADANGKVEFGVPTGAEVSMWAGAVKNATQANAADHTVVSSVTGAATGTFTKA